MLSSAEKHIRTSFICVPGSFVVELFDRFQTYNIKTKEVLDHILLIQMSFLTGTARTMKRLLSI